MVGQNQHLDALQDIRRMMQRSSKFLSLSGLSGIAAGVCGLVGAYFANYLINKSTTPFQGKSGDGYFIETHELTWSLILLSVGVLGAALVSAFYFTWRKASKDKQPIWDHTTKMLTISMMIPLITGGMVILTMLLRYNEWSYAAPLSLIFYGMALVNASKYTVNDIRYLGISEIVLGLVNMQFIGEGLYFWAIGFGVLHIIYGFSMWWKNERNPQVDSIT